MASEAAEILQAIEETREHLGQTVQALAQKTDVKAQFSKAVDHTKQRSREQVEEAIHKVVEVGRPAVAAPAKLAGNMSLLASAGAIVAALGGVWLLVRARGKSRAEVA